MYGALKASGDIGIAVALVSEMSLALAIPAGPAMFQRLATAKAGHVRPATYTILLIPRPNVAPGWVLRIGDFAITHFKRTR